MCGHKYPTIRDLACRENDADALNNKYCAASASKQVNVDNAGRMLDADNRRDTHGRFGASDSRR